MDHSTRLKIAHHKLIHEGKYSINELADLVCRSENYLYKLASFTENHSFPSNLEDRLMELQGNYEPLKIKASKLGFALIKLPRVKAAKGDESEMMMSYQNDASEAVNNLVRFLRKPNNDSYKKHIDSLDKIINASVSHKRYAEKKISKQIDMELE